MKAKDQISGAETAGAKSVNANTFEANQATFECSRGVIFTRALIVPLIPKGFSGLLFFQNSLFE